MGHSKGPWYTMDTGGHRGIVASELTGETIAVTYDKKNAAPISALPDLLEACKIAEEWFNDFVNDKNPWEERPAADLSTIMYEAIEKAEGYSLTTK